MKFRKKPIIVDAVQFKPTINQADLTTLLDNFCGRNWTRADAVDEVGPSDRDNIVIWNTKEKQWLNLYRGHWIIRGVDGELYPCAPEVFDQTYEPV